MSVMKPLILTGWSMPDFIERNLPTSWLISFFRFVLGTVAFAG